MEENKKTCRPSTEVARELNALLARAGAMQHNLVLQRKELAAMFEPIQSLQLEFIASQNAEAAAKEETAQ